MDDNQERKANFAGSWYAAGKSDLTSELQNYLKNAEEHKNKSQVKSVISPHAGFRFSGPTAGWAFRNIDCEQFNRVVLLGPSHRKYIPGCGLTQCKQFDTPLGSITVDTKRIETLLKEPGFSKLDKFSDEAEHSLEMQLPFLRLIFKDKNFKLLPIMVGQTDLQQNRAFAKLLIDFYKDPATLFVVSSDFCHWGARFNFTSYNKELGQIYQSIEDLDTRGMQQIESLSADNLDKYLKATNNTICGRRPISILLSVIEEYKRAVGSKMCSIEFVKYDQSHKVKIAEDSSVSYAAGLHFLVE